MVRCKSARSLGTGPGTVNAPARAPMRRLAAIRRPWQAAFAPMFARYPQSLLLSMTRIAVAALALLYAVSNPAAAEEWGAPAADYSAVLTFTDGRGETLTHRIYYTAKRQRLDYKAGERAEIAIVDQAAAAVFVLYPDQKRYRKAALVEPEFDFGIGRAETKREKVAEEEAAGRKAVKYRVEAATAQGQVYRGFAWLTAERILVKLEGEVKQGRRTRRLSMSASEVKIGPVDAAIFRVPADYVLLEDKRQ